MLSSIEKAGWNAADAAQKAIAESLAAADDAIIFTGLIAARHPAFSAVRALSSAISDATGSRFGSLTEGANSAGAHLAGVLPHRARGGTSRANRGLDAAAIAGGSLDVVMLFGVEPESDLTCIPSAEACLAAQNFVVAMTPYAGESLERAADLLLPVGTFAETAGTFVNCELKWQSFNGVANPVGEARPGWKVLRVLGNLLDAEQFDYQSSEEVRDELAAQIGDFDAAQRYAGTRALAVVNGADSAAEQIDIPIYEVDGVVRRATALQLTPEACRSQGDGS